MAAGKYTFYIEQGATTDFELVWKDSNSDPIDLSFYNGRMQIRTDYGGDLICSLSSSLDSDGTGLNFSGSNGTTPLASKQLNRKYIGIELDEDYFKICKARVEDC